MPAIRLVVVVRVAQVVGVRCKALCELLLAGCSGLLHGRTTERTALCELRRKLDARALKVRVGDVPIGVTNNLVEVLVRTSERAVLCRDVLTAA